MSCYVYKQTETAAEQNHEGPGLWTVGHYAPDGTWTPESDHDNPEKAANRARFLNGGDVNGCRCPRDADGKPVDATLCGNCGREWCGRCDPGPAALCHHCHGRGYSTAPLD